MARVAGVLAAGGTALVLSRLPLGVAAAQGAARLAAVVTAAVKVRSCSCSSSPLGSLQPDQLLQAREVHCAAG